MITEKSLITTIENYLKEIGINNFNYKTEQTNNEYNLHVFFEEEPKNYRISFSIKKDSHAYTLSYHTTKKESLFLISKIADLLIQLSSKMKGEIVFDTKCQNLMERVDKAVILNKVYKFFLLHSDLGETNNNLITQLETDDHTTDLLEELNICDIINKEKGLSEVTFNLPSRSHILDFVQTMKMNGFDINATIYERKTIDFTEAYQQLIDIALDTGDKSWFDDLINKKKCSN